MNQKRDKSTHIESTLFVKGLLTPSPLAALIRFYSFSRKIFVLLQRHQLLFLTFQLFFLSLSLSLQEELEKLNSSTDVINKLEVDLEVSAYVLFRQYTYIHSYLFYCGLRLNHSLRNKRFMLDENEMIQQNTFIICHAFIIRKLFFPNSLEKQV